MSSYNRFQTSKYNTKNIKHTFDGTDYLLTRGGWYCENHTVDSEENEIVTYDYLKSNQKLEFSELLDIAEYMQNNYYDNTKNTRSTANAYHVCKVVCEEALNKYNLDGDDVYQILPILVFSYNECNEYVKSINAYNYCVKTYDMKSIESEELYMLLFEASVDLYIRCREHGTACFNTYIKLFCKKYLSLSDGEVCEYFMNVVNKAKKSSNEMYDLLSGIFEINSLTIYRKVNVIEKENEALVNVECCKNCKAYRASDCISKSEICADFCYAPIQINYAV